MPAPPVHPPASPDAPHDGGNGYSRQLQQRRRAAEAMREADLTIGLRRNAHSAAFASLMRVPEALAEAGPPAITDCTPTPPPAVTRAYEQAVAQRLRRGRSGLPQLGYADRAALFRQAASLGLSRFDANLLMARVQHYHEQAGAAVKATSRRRMSQVWLLTILVVLAVQAALGLVWLRVLGK